MLQVINYIIYCPAQTLRYPYLVSFRLADYISYSLTRSPVQSPANSLTDSPTLTPTCTDYPTHSLPHSFTDSAAFHTGGLYRGKAVSAHSPTRWLASFMHNLNTVCLKMGLSCFWCSCFRCCWCRCWCCRVSIATPPTPPPPPPLLWFIGWTATGNESSFIAVLIAVSAFSDVGESSGESREPDRECRPRYTLTGSRGSPVTLTSAAGRVKDKQRRFTSTRSMVTLVFGIDLCVGMGVE